MLTFNNARRIDDVPVEWIYRHYLNINRPLNGVTVKVRSFINSDTTPSLCVFPKSGMYKWKDFSSGEGGSHVDLIIQQAKYVKGEDISYLDACKKIVEDYNNYLSVHGVFKPSKIEPSMTDYTLDVDFSIAKHSEWDDLFWEGRFGITQTLTKNYNIYPLEYYRLKKIYQNHIKAYPLVEDTNIYGYFTEKGELYQIYQPYNSDMKFIKLKKYIQGSDQLKGYDTLLIGASMKDILVIETCDLQVDTIAPPSESTLLSAEEIQHYKNEYKYIFTLFDNDPAGIKAMKRYKDLYGIDYIYVPYAKDIAEFREESGLKIIRQELTIRINKKINEKS